MNRKSIFGRLVRLFLLSVPLTFALGSSPFNKKPLEGRYLAIIIDDFGNSQAGTQEMLQLPVPITAAIMPGMPNTQKEAEAFHKAGHDVILHMPMEPMNGKKNWLGPLSITANLTPEEAGEKVAEALDQLQYAKGINNHMGSKVTRNGVLMEEILRIARERDLIFIDSLTTPQSKIPGIAQATGAKYLQRDVFLDGRQDPAFVEKRLLQAAEIAKVHGNAIAIGHVGASGGLVTARAIAKLSPKLEAEGIRFVTISQLYSLLND